MEVLNQILAPPSFNLMVNHKSIKGVIHINVIIQDDLNTTHKNSETTREEYELDINMLNKFTTKFRKKTIDNHTLSSNSSSHHLVGTSICSVTRIIHLGISSIAPQSALRLLDYWKRWQTSYPSHEVVGIPSLLPNIEAGTIASWTLSKGDTFLPSNSLCKINTDKATM